MATASASAFGSPDASYSVGPSSSFDSSAPAVVPVYKPFTRPSAITTPESGSAAGITAEMWLFCGLMVVTPRTADGRFCTFAPRNTLSGAAAKASSSTAVTG